MDDLIKRFAKSLSAGFAGGGALSLARDEAAREVAASGGGGGSTENAQVSPPESASPVPEDTPSIKRVVVRRRERRVRAVTVGVDLSSTADTAVMSIQGTTTGRMATGGQVPRPVGPDNVVMGESLPASMFREAGLSLSELAAAFGAVGPVAQESAREFARMHNNLVLRDPITGRREDTGRRVPDLTEEITIRATEDMERRRIDIRLRISTRNRGIPYEGEQQYEVTESINIEELLGGRDMAISRIQRAIRSVCARYATDILAERVFPTAYSQLLENTAVARLVGER